MYMEGYVYEHIDANICVHVYVIVIWFENVATRDSKSW